MSVPRDSADSPSEGPKTRLLLADDHTMLREGLRRSMEAAGFDVVGEARDGDEAVSLVATLHPEVVLMDVSMPVMDGVEATRRIHRSHPDVAVVMLTMHADADVLTQALRAGAVGYLVKDASTEQVVDGVRLAAQGETLLSPELAGSMLQEVQRLGEPTADDEHTAKIEGDGPITKREEEVLQLVAQGLSTSEVAATLFISIKTVKNHLASIYAKLDSRDRTQAVVRAVKMGIIRLQ
jgi:DNA-binding NarL/FixJ family response regulator